MIFDKTDDFKRYAIPYSADITTFIKNNNPLALPPGEIEIKGRSLFVKVLEYETRAVKDASFETHRLYADVQWVVKGHELMHYVPAGNLIELGEYEDKNDAQFFQTKSDISSLIVHANEFAIFFPGEPHRPSCTYGKSPIQVKKLVFKVRFS